LYIAEIYMAINITAIVNLNKLGVLYDKLCRVD
jgi:hypothetical protein